MGYIVLRLVCLPLLFFLEWALLEQLMERCYEDSITLKAQYWL